ncbi:MAG: restriction endonuclease subunit S [Desulfobacteraceae bacterium]|nr:restriction endonuclease subunit S [Desulfobacteraceae bacterium]
MRFGKIWRCWVMRSDWKKISLGDIFKVKHGFAFKGEYFSDTSTQTMLVTPGNFSIGGGFQNNKKKFYDGPIPKEYILEPGQIIVSMTDLSKQTDTLGYAAIVPKNENIWLHNQRIGLLEFNKNLPSDSVFISYLLRANKYRSWIIGSASGTTVKHTSPSRIHLYKCKIPPLFEQKAIAHILGTLDDKIELNRQTNKTLEAMAQAIFKSWFVDFDPVIDNALAAGNEIPDTLKKKTNARIALGDDRKPLPENIRKLFPSSFMFTEKMGWVPEGWDVSTLGDVAENYSGKFDFDKHCYPVFINTGDVFKGDFLHNNLSDKETLPGQAKKQIGFNDILFSEIRPKNKRYAYVNFDVGNYVVSTKFMVIRSLGEIHSRYLYQLLRQNRTIGEFNLIAESRSGTFPQITFKSIQYYPLLVPTKEIQNEFVSLIKPSFKKIDNNKFNNQLLTNLRDTLLPKLLSGELRIPDAEKLIKD